MFPSLNKREFGGQLEAQARTHLERQGCVIIETNYLCKMGEIDIIAKDGETLVFVEVRFRKQNQFGGASASVDAKKRKKICLTASLYLQQKKLTNKIACRFDVIALQGKPQELSVNWIKNAFTTDAIF